MSRPALRHTLGLGAALLAATGGLLMAATPAHAATAKKASVEDITVVGSNTTQEVIGAYAAAFNASSAGSSYHVTNVYAQPADPGTTAPSDAACNGGVAITYIQEGDPGTNQRTAPNGSGAGKAALATSVSNGDSCTSVARSSSPGSASDPSGTKALGYAVDGVSYAYLSGTSAAPANLSMTQLESVYDCSVTNWSQVGGADAPIYRYFPQTGSGTGTFFAGVLGFDPRTVGGVNQCSTPATQIEENETTSIPQDQAADAVMILSGGSYVAQLNGVDTNMVGGWSLGTINGSKNNIVVDNGGTYAPNTSVVTQKDVEPATYMPTDNKKVQGIRNLYNFINTNSVDYKGANAFAGTKSPICTGKEDGIISTYGFVPVSKCVVSS